MSSNVIKAHWKRTGGEGFWTLNCIACSAREGRYKLCGVAFPELQDGRPHDVALKHAQTAEHEISMLDVMAT